MATLKDIAKEAGVSIVTVSNVINGNFKKVSDEKIQLIQKIIDEKQYVPNATAKSLAVKKSNIIGVVIPYVMDDENFLQSPYNAQMLGVIEKNIRSNGYYMMVRCVGQCREVIPVIHTWNVDGVIILGALENEAMELREKIKKPMIFVDTYTSEKKFVSVRVDDYKGGYLATKYLVNNGHHNICFVGPNHADGNVVEMRYNGYVQAMNESGLSDNLQTGLAYSTSFECGIEVGKTIAFWEKVPTAIFATADILALGIMHGLRLSGKRIPEDISVLGFDNLTECRYANPALTTISQNIEKKAQLASDLLFGMIKGKNDKECGKTYVIDVEIVERQSVIPPR